ncbi:hypothetical protein GPJ56_002826 [Histomonas meleagridis]|uniref:uncharacterized protein n=1 Tax=Histomonas meleagridis TaxID=135588 RepID=UPI00355A5190|nr:hypothetical protein GPJ56_002826 [Histomonas meleagridis]KAH0806342.1 hypothetical protein GO595_001030 [Histomonas meleagridis]
MITFLTLFFLQTQSIEKAHQNHVINLYEANNSTSENSSIQSENILDSGDEIARYVSVSIAALLLVVSIVFVVVWYKQHPQCMSKEPDEPISIDSNEEEEEGDEPQQASESTSKITA